MRWAKCSLFIARKFVRTVYLRGWLRCPINLPVNIWKVRWNVNTLLGSTVHNKNKTVMDAGSWGLVVSIRWFQPMRVRTRFLFLVASSFNTNGHVVFFTRRNLGRRPNEPTERLASFDNIPLLHCFDNIPGWLLKENADLLAGAVTDILNASYREGCLPQAWREADVVPVPKQGPIRDVNKHLRPISLTPIISKVAEDYVVEEYIKPMSQRIWISPRIWTPGPYPLADLDPPVQIR